jgi:hypothetical protein
MIVSQQVFYSQCMWVEKCHCLQAHVTLFANRYS